MLEQFAALRPLITFTHGQNSLIDSWLIATGSWHDPIERSNISLEFLVLSV
jgi:hypothetical protein